MIRVEIDRLVLKGIDPADRKALLEGLQNELSRVLSGRAGWAVPHRTPVLRLGQMPLTPGPSGGRKFGANLAIAIGRGLKP